MDETEAAAAESANRPKTAKEQPHKSRHSNLTAVERAVLEVGERFLQLIGPVSRQERRTDMPPFFPRADDPRSDPHVADANRILQKCRVNPETSCWEWQGASSKKGYGRVRVEGRLVLPHRVVATAAGIVTAADCEDRDFCVLHECDNPRCCNPKHLKAGSLSDNMRDCAKKGRLAIQKRAKS